MAQVTRKAGESLGAEGVQARAGRATVHLLCRSPMWCWEGTTEGCVRDFQRSLPTNISSVTKVFKCLPKQYLPDEFSSRRALVCVLLYPFLTTGLPILHVQQRVP